MRPSIACASARFRDPAVDGKPAEFAGGGEVDADPAVQELQRRSSCCSSLRSTGFPSSLRSTGHRSRSARSMPPSRLKRRIAAERLRRTDR